MDLKETELLGPNPGQHWYYRAKLAALRRATADLPPGHVLDVGAGSGFFSRALLEAGTATEATCVDPGYPQDSDEQVATRPLRFRRHVEGPAAKATLVLMMDVLEHVPDDAALVREYLAPSPPGTRFIITVPAFQWLWSGHDVFLEHYRRYTVQRLETCLRTAGLHIEFCSYYYGAVFPLAATMRLAARLRGVSTTEPKSDMRQFHPLLNTLLWTACRTELPLFRHNRLAGLSVFARAVKP